MIAVGDVEPADAAITHEQKGRKFFAGADFGAVFGHVRIVLAQQRQPRRAKNILGFELHDRRPFEFGDETVRALVVVNEIQIRTRRRIIVVFRFIEPMDFGIIHAPTLRAPKKFVQNSLESDGGAINLFRRRCMPMRWMRSVGMIKLVIVLERKRARNFLLLGGQ
jgi:hypothetical protein